jgi:deoxyribonuclease-4
MKALKDFKVGGNVVCESPNLEEDAALLKEAYEKL